jgi:Fur family zinc uptake transcriptional regulator
MLYPSTFIDFCATLDVKLTTLRKEVLYVLWCEIKPLKAYEILERLLKTKSNATPPTVYRVLLFFVACGLVHKIESIQSYTICREAKKQLPLEVLMVCGRCYQVLEMFDEAVGNLLARLAMVHDFSLRQDAIELKGTCRSCMSNTI